MYQISSTLGRMLRRPCEYAQRSMLRVIVYYVRSVVRRPARRKILCEFVADSAALPKSKWTELQQTMFA